MAIDGPWPDIPYPAWKETAAALHLMTQVVGKYRLARTPWINHSWHATLYVTSTGLMTGLVPDGHGITVTFDLQRHRLVASDGRGSSHGFPLEAMSLAEFDRRFKAVIAQSGGTPRFHGRPNELPDATPFSEDTANRPWDADAVSRFHAALVRIEAVFQEFRTGFLGKVSPVHLFWGSFDLAVTRFSGRTAPLHPGGIANLPDDVTREAYSHEVSSAGFWPGGSGIDEPCFYSYAYPSPAGFSGMAVELEGARFDSTLGEFILPYAAVRAAADPKAALLAFLQSTYAAAADLAQWDRASLECETGIPQKPRVVG